MAQVSLAEVHKQFEAALPAIQTTARFAFRNRRPQDRDEAVAEACAAAWSAWYGIFRRGKDPIAVGITGIARNAVRHVKNGRRLGNRHCGRGAMDMMNDRSGFTRQFGFIDIDKVAGLPACETESWRDCLLTDRRFGPAAAAVFRLDFTAFIGLLPASAQRVASLLGAGYGTVETARMCSLSPGRVSQLRAELLRRWTDFDSCALA